MKLVTSLLVRSLIAQKIEREPTVPNYFLQENFTQTRNRGAEPTVQ